MTKEELKEEAIRYAVDYPTSYGKGYKHKDLRIAYLAGAEPREKRIAELEQKLEQTEKDLTDYQFNYPKIKDLEKQIEKMKCGQNCKHSYLYQEDRKCKFTYCDCINCKDKWEMKE